MLFCCSIDVHQTLIVAVMATTSLAMIVKASQPLGMDSSSYETGWNNIPALMFLGNPLLNTGFPSPIVYNICLLHSKWVKTIRAKKANKKVAQWRAALFKQDLIASSFIPSLTPDRALLSFTTVWNEVHSKWARKNVLKTVWLVLISKWQVSFLMFLERVPKIWWKIHRKSQLLNSWFTREWKPKCQT